MDIGTIIKWICSGMGVILVGLVVLRKDLDTIFLWFVVILVTLFMYVLISISK